MRILFCEVAHGSSNIEINIFVLGVDVESLDAYAVVCTTEFCAQFYRGVHMLQLRRDGCKLFYGESAAMQLSRVREAAAFLFVGEVYADAFRREIAAGGAYAQTAYARLLFCCVYACAQTLDGKARAFVECYPAYVKVERIACYCPERNVRLQVVDVYV